MNTQAFACHALSLCLALASGLAFSVAAAAETSSSPEETITLSPFTVSTERDVGFVATSSLAGGRLSGELKDTPVAYSVLTREFINALGIDDLTQAVEWTVGAHQNVDAGANAIFAASPSYSVRGVSGLTALRNFFPLGLTFDSYNLDRFDFGRGPNSVLFGAGSIGGAANTVTKQAVFGRPIRQLEAKAGSWSNYRATTDLNTSARDVAVRVNTLWQDSKGWRDDDYQRKKSAFATATWRVGPRTQLRVEGEYGEQERRSAYTNLNDRISGWDGRTTYAATPTVTIPGTTRNAAGVSQYGSDNWVYSQAFGTDSILGFQNVPMTQAAKAAGTFMNGRAIVGTDISANGQAIHYQPNLPEDRFDAVIAGSSFRLPDREFTPRFTNRPTFRQRYRDVALYFNHQIGQSFFLEIAGDYNRENRFGDTTYNRSLNDVYVDITRTLPTGAPNPNFLKPYFESAVRYDNDRGTETLNGRLAAAYVADTRVGRFILNFLGGANRQDATLRARQLTLPFEGDSRLWAGKHFIRYRQYWDQADRTMTAFDGPVSVVDPIAGTTRSLTPLLVLDTTRADSNADRSYDYDYANLAMQAKLFGGRLNVVAAYRRDEYNNSAKVTRFAGDYPAGWDGQSVLWRPDAPADYYTLPAVVARDAAGNPTGGSVAADTRPRDTNGFALPQYANDRFRDDTNAPAVKGGVSTRSVGTVWNLTRWLGLAVNVAETFNPPSGMVGYDGSLIPPSVAKGYDFGLRLNLLDGRVSASLNRFDSREDNAVAMVPSGSSNNFNTIFQANAIGDTSANGRNIRGFGDLPVVLRDTVRRKTSGLEAEVTANLTRQWRLLANLSISRPIQDNAYPLTMAYWAEHEKDFRQILADSGVLVDPVTKVAAIDPKVSTALSPNASSAAAAWNGIQSTFLANVVTGPRLISGSARYTANVFTDYRFRAGWLDGVKAGLGVNYRARQVIGYRGGDTIVDPANPAVAIDDPAVDAYTPVYASSYYLCTGTLSYTWKLSRGQRLSLDLRVDNLLNDDDVRYFQNGGSGTGGTVQRPRDGDLSSPARVATAAAFSYPVPRSWTLTARLDF